jgi:hypothetical protein
MDDQSETFARHLVRALYYATDGRARWWLLPANLNDVTNEALAIAVERGWMVMDQRGALRMRSQSNLDIRQMTTATIRTPRAIAAPERVKSLCRSSNMSLSKRRSPL